jgi:hypothetical protein
MEIYNILLMYLYTAHSDLHNFITSFIGTLPDVPINLAMYVPWVMLVAGNTNVLLVFTPDVRDVL